MHGGRGRYVAASHPLWCDVKLAFRWVISRLLHCSWHNSLAKLFDIFTAKSQKCGEWAVESILAHTLEEMFSNFGLWFPIWVLLLKRYNEITTWSMANTSLYVDNFARVLHNSTLTFFTIKFICLQESWILNTSGMAVEYIIARPSSTCLAKHFCGYFRKLFQTTVTWLQDKDPFAFPGILPRG
jgi:hypothetical protein